MATRKRESALAYVPKGRGETSKKTGGKGEEGGMGSAVARFFGVAKGKHPYTAGVSSRSAREIARNDASGSGSGKAKAKTPRGR